MMASMSGHKFDMVDGSLVSATGSLNIWLLRCNKSLFSVDHQTSDFKGGGKPVRENHPVQYILRIIIKEEPTWKQKGSQTRSNWLNCALMKLSPVYFVNKRQQ